MEEKKLSLEEFDGNLRKKNAKRNHKIKNSWGEYDFYKWLRKRKWKDVGKHINEKDFYKLIDRLFDEIGTRIAEGESLKLPYRLGTFELAKKEGQARYYDGKMIANYQVDWQKTIKLWYEDKEAMQKRQLVKFIEKNIYKIVFLRRTNTFIALFPSRNLKQKIKKSIQENRIDAFEYQPKYNRQWNT